MRALALLICLPLLVPAGARAATVHSDPGSKYVASTLTFEATAGEANDVTVSGPPAERRVVDSGAPLAAGDGCRQVSEHEAVCRNAYEMHFSLGDGADRATLTKDVRFDGSYVDGDAGDDVLLGGPADDDLAGGDGHDTISGGAGNDSIAGDGDVAFSDRLDGGAGTDELDYGHHPVGVTVDLADPSAPAGGHGEGDEQSGFEDVTAGAAGPSELIGDEHDNRLLTSGPGSRLVGAAGDDRLTVGRESVAQGSSGDDVIVSTRTSRVECGAGNDLLESGGGGYRRSNWFASGFGLIARDCERLPLDFPNIDDAVARPHPKLRGSRASFRIPCPDDPDSRGGCTGRVALRDTRGGLLGERRFRTRERSVPAVGVSLGEGTLRRLARPEGLEVVISIIVHKFPYEWAEGRWSIVLTSP